MQDLGDFGFLPAKLFIANVLRSQGAKLATRLLW